MNTPSLVTDNLTEVLVKIIEFTQTRQKFLTRNINNVDSPGFVPEDLDVNEFSALLNGAIDEHIRTRRLLLRDTEKIKFGPRGTFEAKPVVDSYAEKLRQQNRNGYLELQAARLLENALNQKVAAELLRQKQDMMSIFG